jgi:hypothetical protein
VVAVKGVQVRFGLQLGRGLEVPADSQMLRDAVRGAIRAELVRQGLPCVPALVVTESSAPRAIRLRAGGRFLRFEPQLLTRVWQSAAPPALHAVAVTERPPEEGFPDAWLPEALSGLPADEAGWLLADVAVALVPAVLRRHPAAVLDERVLAAYVEEMAAQVPEARAVDMATWQQILPSLVELTGTLASPAAVGNAILGALDMGLEPSDAVESAFAQLRQGTMELLRNPADLAATDQVDPDEPTSVLDDLREDGWRDRFMAVEDTVFRVTGLPLPEIRFVPSEAIPVGHAQVVWDGVPGLITSMSGADRLLVAAPAEALEPDLGALGTIHTVGGGAAALVRAEARPRLEAAGLDFFDSRDLMLWLAVKQLRESPRRILSIDDLEHRLDLLRRVFPAIVRAATAAFGLGDLLRLVRSLIDEQIPVRDLRLLLDRLLAYAPEHGRAEPGSFSIEDYEDFVRAGLAERFAARFGSNGKLEVVTIDPDTEQRLSEPGGVDPDGRLADRIREAAWSERDRLLGGTPVLVTSARARRALRSVLADELPLVTVLADHELPLSLERVAMARVEPAGYPAPPPGTAIPDS